jgi:hypothetical protein
MTTMLLSATLPAFAASGFVFEDWDLGIVSERKEATVYKGLQAV